MSLNEESKSKTLAFYFCGLPFNESLNVRNTLYLNEV